MNQVWNSAQLTLRFRMCLLLWLSMWLLIAGCVGTSSGQVADGDVGDDAVPPSAKTDELVVFAAASLTNALGDLADAFVAENGGVEVIFNFAGSSQLALQLREGAAADIFASANPQQMARVVEAGRIADTPVSFASNGLTVIVPADNPAEIETLSDLANPGLLLIVAAPGVPARDYTDQVMASLAEDEGFGQKYVDGVYANVVSEEENVRQVVAKVALGEADAGIVYTSDVTPEIVDRVRQVEIPTEHNVVARYPIAVIEDGANPRVAEQFIEFVTNESGREILERWGFGQPVAQ